MVVKRKIAPCALTRHGDFLRLIAKLLCVELRTFKICEAHIFHSSYAINQTFRMQFAISCFIALNDCCVIAL